MRCKHCQSKDVAINGRGWYHCYECIRILTPEEVIFEEGEQERIENALQVIMEAAYRYVDSGQFDVDNNCGSDTAEGE